MATYLEKKNNCFKTCEIKRKEDEKPVQSGLSMSPAEALEMALKGVPLSQANLPSIEVYRTSDNDYSVPMEFRRNADPADMYQFRQEIHKKVKAGQETYLSNLSKSSENE